MIENLEESPNKIVITISGNYKGCRLETANKLLGKMCRYLYARHETMIFSQVSQSTFPTWGIAQNRIIAGSRNADMYFKQSSIWIKALVTISFKHCTALSEFSSYFKSWGADKRGESVYQISLHYKNYTWIYLEQNDEQRKLIIL